MTLHQRKRLIRIAVCASLFVALMIFRNKVQSVRYLEFILFLIPYLLIGYDVLWKAVRNLSGGQIFDENFLMSIASVGALAIKEYPEAIAVLLFYQVGSLFEDCAVGKSRKSISALMDIRPDCANVLRQGKVTAVHPDSVAVGETIVVRPGEKIPLDGVIVRGSTSLDTAALTGESMPRTVTDGDEAVSGTVNLTGKIEIRVTKPFGESTVSKILDLVENAGAKKAKTENFISKFARYYTPAVVFSAVLLGIIPSIVTGQWSVWIYRALSFLVTSCPCALVISIPLGFFGGMGAASKKGILIKGGSYIEVLANTKTVVFDKTGTLTEGNFYVTAVYPAEGTARDRLLECAALAESNSNHPIGKSILAAYDGDIDGTRIKEVFEVIGKGVVCVAEGHKILVGNEKLMQVENIAYRPCNDIGTAAYVACDGKFLGSLVIADRIKSDAKTALSQLKTLGIRRTVMLTGDRKDVGEYVAAKAGIDEVYPELLPSGKVEKMEEILEKKRKKEFVAFVGDGINDAPVLSRADIGISMGSIGSDAAVEASDVVLMDDRPPKIAEAVRISKRTMKIVYANIIFSLVVKLSVLVLIASGILNMWAAVFADVGVSVIAILNAMRLLKPGK